MPFVSFVLRVFFVPCSGCKPTYWSAQFFTRLFRRKADLSPVSLSCAAPFFFPSLADTEAIIATADPGDYGDRIMVAMNVEITETGESTDRAAAVRDAGAKVKH